MYFRCVVGVAVVLACAQGFAAPLPTDATVDARFRAEIAKVNADAAVAWDQGNAARDALRYSDAQDAYRKAATLAPNVDHPHRRLCGIDNYFGKVDDAIKECELALSLAPASPYDKSALAAVLIARSATGDRKRAAELAHEAAVALPDDVPIVQQDCQARAAIKDFEGLSECADRLLAFAPDDPFGNYIAAGIDYNKRDYTRASVELERAKDNGLAPDLYQKLHTRLDKARADAASSGIDTDRAIAIGVPILLGWLLLLVALLVAGNLLSEATRSGADHAIDADPTPRERRLRAIYRVVLLITAITFYISLPLMLIVVTAAGLVTFAIFDQMGATPVIIIVLVIGIVVSTYIAVFRALFYQREPAIEGTPLDLASYPKLRALLDEVAATIGTRPVDVVYLVPGTDMAVTEYRSMLRSLLGTRSKRILLMGVGLFHGMKQLELRSILAHEYGHFRNDDVGARTLSVQRSLTALVQRMSGTRAATRLNPAWWFLRAYTHLYMVVSRGASRLQEVLADRWAIRAYGSAAFVAAYRHTVTREVEFKRDLVKTLNDVIKNKWSLPNLYAYDVEHDRTPADLQAEVNTALNREPGQYDTHPAPRHRLDWAARLALPAERTRPDDDEPVWSLFSDPEDIERAMTAVIRDRVRTKTGVTISDAEWADD